MLPWRSRLPVLALALVLAQPTSGRCQDAPPAKKPELPARLTLAEGVKYRYRYAETARARSDNESKKKQSSTDQRTAFTCELEFEVAEDLGGGAYRLEVVVTQFAGSYESESMEKRTWDSADAARSLPGVGSQLGKVNRVTLGSRGEVHEVAGPVESLFETGTDEERALRRKVFFQRFFATLPAKPLRRSGQWERDRNLAPDLLLGGQQRLGSVPERCRVTKLAPGVAGGSITSKGKNKIENRPGSKRRKGSGPPNTSKQLGKWSVKGSFEIDTDTGLYRLRTTAGNADTFQRLQYRQMDIAMEATHEFETRLEALAPAPEGESDDE